MHDHQDDEDEKLFAAIQHAAANLPPRPRGKKAGKDTFVKVPLWWFERVAHAVQSPQQAFVAVWLLHLSWKAKSKTFPVPNGQLEQSNAAPNARRWHVLRRLG
jgi:hypothetical protein